MIDPSHKPEPGMASREPEDLSVDAQSPYRLSAQPADLGSFRASKRVETIYSLLQQHLREDVELEVKAVNFSNQLMRLNHLEVVELHGLVIQKKKELTYPQNPRGIAGLVKLIAGTQVYQWLEDRLGLVSLNSTNNPQERALGMRANQFLLDAISIYGIVVDRYYPENEILTANNTSSNPYAVDNREIPKIYRDKGYPKLLSDDERTFLLASNRGDIIENYDKACREVLPQLIEKLRPKFEAFA